MLFTAESTIRSFMRCIGLWMPGVSKSTTCPSGLFTTARMRLRVVCGLSETMATFWPTSWFTSVDFPTLGRPTRETNPADLHASTSSGLRRKRTRCTRLRSASTISMVKPR